MPEMPAFCKNCGAIFGSGMVFDNCINVTLRGNTSQCPQCGGIGEVPDGVFDMTNNAIKMISGTSRSIKNLKKLALILTEAQKSNTSKEQIESIIKKEVPELSSFPSILPQTRNELYAFITLILTAIGILVTSTSTIKPLSESEVIEITERTIQKAMIKPKKKYKNSLSTDSTHKKKKKTGRNEPCPCGSGEKYKRCCLVNKPINI
jgi:uncharacterized protein YecA (UPF0149 family)